MSEKINQIEGKNNGADKDNQLSELTRVFAEEHMDSHYKYSDIYSYDDGQVSFFSLRPKIIEQSKNNNNPNPQSDNSEKQIIIKDLSDNKKDDKKNIIQNDAIKNNAESVNPNKINNNAETVSPAKQQLINQILDNCCEANIEIPKNFVDMDETQLNECLKKVIEKITNTSPESFKMPESTNFSTNNNNLVGEVKEESKKPKKLQIKNLSNTKKDELSDWNIVDFNKQEVRKDVLLRDVDLDDQGVTNNCYAFVAAALLRNFAKVNGMSDFERVNENDLLNRYGVEEMQGFALDYAPESYRGAVNKDKLIWAGNIKANKEGKYGDAFKKVKEIMLRNSAMNMGNIVEAIHDVSKGKAALNVGFYDKDNADSLKDMIHYVLTEKKQSVGLLPTEKDHSTGHYILVTGLTSDGFIFRDSKIPEKGYDTTTDIKMTWDDLFNKNSAVQLCFLDKIPTNSKNYTNIANLDEGEERRLNAWGLFDEDDDAITNHLQYTDIFHYNDSNRSCFNLRPKKKQNHDYGNQQQEQKDRILTCTRERAKTSSPEREKNLRP